MGNYQPCSSSVRRPGTAEEARSCEQFLPLSSLAREVSLSEEGSAGRSTDLLFTRMRRTAVDTGRMTHGCYGSSVFFRTPYWTNRKELMSPAVGDFSLAGDGRANSDCGPARPRFDFEVSELDIFGKSGAK